MSILPFLMVLVVGSPGCQNISSIGEAKMIAFHFYPLEQVWCFGIPQNKSTILQHGCTKAALCSG
jgi:hypothetical protein